MNPKNPGKLVMDTLENEQLEFTYPTQGPMENWCKFFYLKAFKTASIWIWDPATAEDLAQQAFLKIWDQIEYYRNKPEQDFNRLLNRIVFHLFVDLIREARRLPMDEGSIHIEEMMDETSQSAINQLQIKLDLTKFLSQLPPIHRKVLILHYLGGYTHQEIAEKMKKSKKSIESISARAVKKLKKIFHEARVLDDF